MTTILQRELEAQVLEIPELAADPQTKPIIKWVSDALTERDAELENARAELYRCFVERMFPEPEGRVFPAHAIAQAHPGDKTQELSADWERTADRTSVYFAPLYPVVLSDVIVCYQAAFQTLETCQDDRKIKLAELETPLPLNSFCIGLEVGEDLDELDGLTLMFDGLPEAKYPLLPLIRYRCAGKPVDVQKGWPTRSDNAEPFPDAEYLRLERVRKRIAEHYEKHFFHLVRLAAPKTATCPSYLEALLPEAVRERPVVWLELVLPDGLTAGDMAGLLVRSNCFPVWNARMRRQRETYPDGAALIPLCDEGEKSTHQFLGIQKVWSDSRGFGPSELTAPGEPCYAVQCGCLEDFRRSELVRRIDSLLQLMESYGLPDFTDFATEHPYEMGFDHIGDTLRQLNSATALLQQQMARIPAHLRQPQYYLRLQATGREVVYFDYFLSQGSLTARVIWPDERNLIPGEHETVSLKIARLITAVTDGRDALRMPEREALIRRKLSKSFYNDSMEVL